MAIDFTVFYTRLGKMAFLMSNWNTYLNTTLPADVINITDEFTGSALAIVDGITAQQAVAQTNTTMLTTIQQYAQNLALTTVNDDNPQLSNTDLSLALKEIVRQMYAQAVTVKKSTVGQTVTPAGGNIGNGVCVCSVVRYDGLDQENLLAEDVTVKCTADQNNNASLAFTESFQATGQNTQADPLGFNWPLGSGASVGFNAIDGDSDNNNGNLLTNSGFATWTVADIPDGWEIVTGTAGVTVLEGGTAYTGASSLEIAGNGMELTKLTQTFNDDSGTPGQLADLTNYAVACWLRVSAVPTGGVLTIDLIDGSATVVADEQAVSNSIQVNLNTLSSSAWTSFKGVFRTPQEMPAIVKIRLRLSTALDNGKNLFIGKLGLGEMSSLYAGGPSVAVFSGSLPFYAAVPNGTGDYFTAAVTNNQGGASNSNTFQTVAQRFYNMTSLNLLLPSAGSPTISNGLIS